MSVTITINDRRKLSVEGGKSLFATLRDAGIFIPSICGGRGLCGRCRLKVLEGAGKFSPAELRKLSDKERAENVRLSCQVSVENDLSVVIPDELLGIKQYESEVTSIRDLTPDIKEVRLKLLSPAEIRFKAGQYIQLRIPPYDQIKEPVYRPYSIASSPSCGSEIELEIRYVPNGISTTYVHKRMKVGERISVIGPDGDFCLRDSDTDIIFIAGGSGMAPIRSILLDMAGRKSSRVASYFFGAKAKRDLFLVEEMQELEKSLPYFKFIPALSDPQPGDEWSGETGLITEVVSRHLDKAGRVEAYLCGSPLMIDACVKVLKAKGVPEELIFHDKFA